MLERLDRARTLGGNLSTGQRIAVGAGAAGALVLTGGIINRHNILNRIMRSDALVHSNAPNYRKVNWGLTEIGHAEVNKWVKLVGDPEGSRLPVPSLYKSAGVLAVESVELDELKQQYPKSVPAVGWQLGKHVVVGELSGEEPFGATPSHIIDGESTRAIGLRRGRDDLVATVGYWDPATQVFAAAESQRIIDEGVLINEMHLDHMYPKVPIV